LRQCLLILLCILGSPPLLAQEKGGDGVPDARIEPVPDELMGITIDEKIGERIPLDVELLDENGKTVRTEDLLDGKTPVVLILGYFRCPMLCGLVEKGLVESLGGIDLVAGKDFTVLQASIDPTDMPVLARLKKKSMIEALGHPEAASRWHVLTGKATETARLADSVGFRYRIDERTGEYAHAAAVFVLTPDGTVSRTLYGVRFPGMTLRLSIVEASEGRLGTPLDQVLLFCFQYDGTRGRYALAARNIMRAGGALTLLVLLLVILRALRREARKKRERSPASGRAIEAKELVS